MDARGQLELAKSRLVACDLTVCTSKVYDANVTRVITLHDVLMPDLLITNLNTLGDLSTAAKRIKIFQCQLRRAQHS